MGEREQEEERGGDGGGLDAVMPEYSLPASQGYTEGQSGGSPPQCTQPLMSPPHALLKEPRGDGIGTGRGPGCTHSRHRSLSAPPLFMIIKQRRGRTGGTCLRN